MKNSPQMTRLGLLGVFLVILGVGVFQIYAEPATPPGHCPLCQAEGIPVPDRDQLAKCECEKWWNGHSPARLVFVDCSSRQCAENGIEDADVLGVPRVFVDIQLYRCPKDGLLFTDAE